MKFDATNLPSRCIPYAVKAIEVTTFRPSHMVLISEAIHTDNDAPMIQAVGQVMDFDVNQLTQGDYYYILTWLRFHSRKLPVFSEWDCAGVMLRRRDNELLYTIEQLDEMYEQWDATVDSEARKHLEDPGTFELLEVDCNHYNKELIGFDDFSVRLLNEEPLPIGLDYPRVRHLVEYIEFLKEPRYRELAGPLCYIKDGDTLRKKLELIEKSGDMDLFDAASKANFTHDHGILQRVNKKCAKCGIEHPFNFAVSAGSFFA